MNPVEAALTEPLGFDELRVIAQDESRLTKQDKAALLRCADEGEAYQRAWRLSNVKLIEAQCYIMAMNEHLTELHRSQ